ncbi:spore coat putative kinase YutH [Bacillus sp. FJAT-45350]|uniref:spore coat putative kinase YutH n=1 Tax=Bacillus sp. FJAT-45350 TaxID=2011014 RepID=UPI0015C90B58|nr:spore coat protein YutH [Bacillus sp. FJAT-45350]
MFGRNIYDHYNLYCEQLINIGKYEGFVANGELYIAVPANDRTEVSPEQVLSISEQVNAYGDTKVAQHIRTKDGQMTALVDGETIFLYRIPPISLQYDGGLGKELASFHQNGVFVAESRQNWDGATKWKELWEKRLQQLERWYEHILMQPHKTEIDEAFLFTFPYYMGLTENAIQYVVDGNLDDTVRDRGFSTVCHRHFTDSTWLTLEEGSGQVKVPTDWIIDHPSRDIAEWIRYQMLNQDEPLQSIEKFLNEYENVRVISPYGWRLIYGRLLFPLHYFEAIENCYSACVTTRALYEEEFLQVLAKEEQNEKLLRNFYSKLHIPYREVGLSVVDWLS